MLCPVDRQGASAHPLDPAVLADQTGTWFAVAELKVDWNPFEDCRGCWSGAVRPSLGVDLGPSADAPAPARRLPSWQRVLVSSHLAISLPLPIHRRPSFSHCHLLPAR